jgi:epoxyqueuosine reductase
MIKELLTYHLTPADQYISGLADLTGLLDPKFGTYRTGISIGRKLDDRIVDALTEGPTLEYYDHYRQINQELNETARRIRDDLQEQGIDAIVIKPTVSTGSKEFEESMATLTVDVSHKMVATRAGLGWIGKTDLLVSRAFGPRLRLVSLLIDRELNGLVGSVRPIEQSRCGTCTICVDQCPAQAANGLSWNSDLHRDAFFDAHKCRDMCAELASQRLNVDERICGLCVSVCPFGIRKNPSQSAP